MRAPDVLHACFGEAEVFHFALADELFHGAGDVFDRHVRIDAMLIEEVDRLDAQSLERTVDGAANRVGTAVESGELLPVLLEVEAELRGDDDAAAERRERFADNLFVREWTVDLRGVEERDATLDGAANQCDCVVSVRGLSSPDPGRSKRVIASGFLIPCAVIHSLPLVSPRWRRAAAA
jgi:hypothetical protein